MRDALLCTVDYLETVRGSANRGYFERSADSTIWFHQLMTSKDRVQYPGHHLLAMVRAQLVFPEQA